MGLFPVGKLQNHPDVETWKKAILESQEILLAYGIVAITDMAVSREAIAAWKEIADTDGLKMRVDTSLIMNDYFGEEADPQGTLKLLDQFKTRLLDPMSVKWGADGTPLTGTSVMLEPYKNNPDSHGIPTVNEDMKAQMLDNMDAGFQMRVHAIGDGTARMAIDLIEKARKKNPNYKRPAQLAHALWVHPDDMDRMRELDIVADMSPPVYFRFAQGDLYNPILGKERADSRANIAELIRRGVTVSYGSDWPASAPNANPFRHLEGMITRENPDGPYPGGPLGEPIDLAAGLKIMTINGAYAMEHNDITGSIEVGKFADMIVLDQNPFDLVEAGKAKDISDIKVRRTIFEGNVVYEGG
jgi:hypothetical protein